MNRIRAKKQLSFLSEPEIEIHYMLLKHIPGVVRIEMQPDSVNPWGVRDFRSRIFSEQLTSHSYGGIVAVVDDAVVGHAIYRRQADHILVLNFRVATSARHNGIGFKLLYSISMKRTAECGRIEFLVPERAIEMQLFLREFKFVCLETFRGVDNGSDLYRFVG